MASAPPKDDLMDFFNVRKPFPKVYLPVSNDMLNLLPPIDI